MTERDLPPSTTDVDSGSRPSHLLASGGARLILLVLLVLVVLFMGVLAFTTLF